MIRATPDWRGVVEEWRSRQRPIPSEAEAIRRLVEIGAAAEGQRVPKRELARPGRAPRTRIA